MTPPSLHSLCLKGDQEKSDLWSKVSLSLKPLRAKSMPITYLSMWGAQPWLIYLSMTFLCLEDYWAWILQTCFFISFSFMKAFSFYLCFLRQLFHFTDICYVILWQASASFTQEDYFLLFFSIQFSFNLFFI